MRREFQPQARSPPRPPTPVPSLPRWAGLGRPLPSPHAESHAYWLEWVGVAAGLLGIFPGAFRSWLSRWRSRFSSHMSTEALREAVWGGSGGTDPPKAVG